LIEAITDGDAEAAASLMQAHVLKAKQVLLKFIEQRYGKPKPGKRRQVKKLSEKVA
jgi:hypothetical protein